MPTIKDAMPEPLLDSFSSAAQAKTTAEAKNPNQKKYRGRFAPSPTGELHLGSAAAAIFCAAAARNAQGTLVLRMEDLDRDRVIESARAGILEDLRWLGISWDEGPDIGGPFAPYDQSQRLGLYEQALASLTARGLTYLCDCSRAEISRAASAPHAGEEGPRYPGTCRAFGHQTRTFKRPPAVRLAVPQQNDDYAEAFDHILGSIGEHVGEITGDFVLRRGDGVFAYQFAVVVDDFAMGITDVVRGADLASSVPRQALLFRLLGAQPPRYAHIPLLYGHGKTRLSKREKGVPIRDQRTMGHDPKALVRAIALAYGHSISGGGDPLDRIAEQLNWEKLKGIEANVDQIVDQLNQ